MPSAPPIVAALEIGSSAIHMTLTQFAPEGPVVLEELGKSIRLAKDAFSRGALSKNLVADLVALLGKYRDACREYGVAEICAVATSSVAAAENMDILIDHIRLETGIEVEPISSLVEIETIYLALREKLSLSKEKKFPAGEVRGMLKIGAGSVFLTLFDGEHILASFTLPLGVVQLRQIFESHAQEEIDFPTYLKISVDHELAMLASSFPVKQIEVMYAFGNEMEALQKILDAEFSNDASPSSVSSETLEAFLERIKGMGREELVSTFGVPYDLTEFFFAVTYILHRVSLFFESGSVEIAPVNLRDGLFIRHLRPDRDEKDLLRIERQLYQDALNIGRALRFEEAHALTVTEFALKIFDLAESQHGLGKMERAYLMTASILHDVGYAVSYAAHHKHSFYIIMAKEFFFITEREKLMIALIARYHRKAGAKSTHPDFQSLSRREKMTVLKLASILRIAEGLDYQRVKNIKSIEARRTESGIVFEVETSGNVFGEIYSFNEKKAMFEDLFGLTLSLSVKNETRTSA